MFILKKGHQPGVYVPLRALFLVFLVLIIGVMPLLKGQSAILLVRYSEKF